MRRGRGGGAFSEQTNQKLLSPNQAARAMPFSARALKENIFFDVDIVIKNVKIKIWFIVVCTLIENEYRSLLFSQTFFRIVSVC